MAYLCESVAIIDSVNYGVNCVVHSGFLPDLTDEARDELLKWMFSCFVSVFVAKKVFRLFGS